MIGVIENAILARLKAAAEAKVLGYAYRKLEALPLDAEPDQLAREVKAFPAAWVVYGGWDKLQDIGDGSSLVRMTFGVLVGAENLRNPNASRQGADGKVGSYQMALDAAGLLMGQDFDLAIGGLRLGAMKPLVARDQVSIFSVLFTTDVQVDPMGSDLGTPAIGDFDRFHVNWDVPPFEEATILPADANDDATSDVVINPPENA